MMALAVASASVAISKFLAEQRLTQRQQCLMQARVSVFLGHSQSAKNPNSYLGSSTPSRRSSSGCRLA